MSTDERSRTESPPSLSSPPAVPSLLSNPQLAEQRDYAIGVRVGRFTIVRRLGHGGMSVVYEAEQEMPVRRVALKLLNRVAAAPELLSRFRQEAQILAELQHPYIAKIYEAGVHGVGPTPVAYIAMELVDAAQTLREHAIAGQLSTVERLRLFAKVCAAVAHAHGQGVIHRDLKPANILVRADGEPRVIDFGIARVLAPSMANRADTTVATQLLGTIQYMSPEQGSGLTSDGIRPVDDVYALGVNLFELLLERLPYVVPGGDPSRIAEIASSAFTLNQHSARRALGAGLSAVVSKAMHPQRSRRYASVQELADDIERHLAGEAVVARPDSARYRFGVRVRKTLRRRPLTVCLLAGVAAFAMSEATGSLLDARGFQETFDAAMVRNVRFTPDAPFAHTRVIGIEDDAAALSAAATEHHIAAFDASDRFTYRALYGAILPRLAAAHPKLVVFDLTFSGDSGYDDALAAGIERARAAGVSVIIANATWGFDVPAGAGLSKAVARAAADGIGGMTMSTTPHRLWSVHLLVRRGGRRPLPSISCLAWAISQGLPAQADFEQGLGVIAASAGPKYASTRVTDISQMNTDWGWADELPDEVSHLHVQLPSEANLAASTVPLHRVVAASEQELRSEFENKVVLIGDLRPSHDGPYPYLGNRSVNGVYSHAAAVESLVSGRIIRHPAVTEIAANHLYSRWLFDVAAAAVMFIIATKLRARSLALVTTLAAGGVACVTFLMFRQAGLLVSPLIPLFIVVTSGVFVGAAAYLTRRAAKAV